MTELAGKLREAANLHDPVAKAAIELIRIASEDAKDSLVTLTGDDMLRAQGAARQFAKMHTELTVTPPSITGNPIT